MDERLNDGTIWTGLTAEIRDRIVGLILAVDGAGAGSRSADAARDRLIAALRPAPAPTTPAPLERCPHTPDGRLPPDEISACEFCPGTAPCLDYRVPVPPELEPASPQTTTAGEGCVECGCRETYPQLVPGRVSHGPGCRAEPPTTAGEEVP